MGMGGTRRDGRLRRAVVALAAIAALSGAGLVGGSVGAPSAAAATNARHASQHTTSKKKAEKPAKLRIAPWPKALRDLPGADHVLYDGAKHAAVLWTARPAPCPGPHGRTIRPKSVLKGTVLGGWMLGWCPLHPADVLLYVPSAITVTPGYATLVLPAGTVVKSLPSTTGGRISLISTGARSFKVTGSVEKALTVAVAATMRLYDFLAWRRVFVSGATLPALPLATLGQTIARNTVDPKSPYYSQVAKGPLWVCTLAKSRRADVLRYGWTISRAPSASVAASFTVVKDECSTGQPYTHQAATAVPFEYANVQVTPLRSYISDHLASHQRGYPAGFFVEANRTLSRVYRVWAPWGAELSFNEPWLLRPGHPGHWLHVFVSGWAELRPAHQTTTDPRTMQVWQPEIGAAAWPSGFIAGFPPTVVGTYAFTCATPSTAPQIVRSTRTQGTLPQVVDTATICH